MEWELKHFLHLSSNQTTAIQGTEKHTGTREYFICRQPLFIFASKQKQSFSASLLSSSAQDRISALLSAGLCSTWHQRAAILISMRTPAALHWTLQFASVSAALSACLAEEMWLQLHLQVQKQWQHKKAEDQISCGLWYFFFCFHFLPSNPTHLTHVNPFTLESELWAYIFVHLWFQSSPPQHPPPPQWINHQVYFNHR